MMITLMRAQIGHSSGYLDVDVTVRTARGWARKMAPTWDMVMSHKFGDMTDAQYIWLYDKLLHERGLPVEEMTRVARGIDCITFLCYCPNGAFCHTHVLIDILVRDYPKLFVDGRIQLCANPEKPLSVPY